MELAEIVEDVADEVFTGEFLHRLLKSRVWSHLGITGVARKVMGEEIDQRIREELRSRGLESRVKETC